MTEAGIRFLTFDEVLVLHADQIARYGGSEGILRRPDAVVPQERIGIEGGSAARVEAFPEARSLTGCGTKSYGAWRGVWGMKNILVIDDDEALRNVMVLAFSEYGFCARGASNGADGFAMLRESPRPDFVLLDWNMPIMDGPTFLSARSKEQVLASIPVIVLSASPTAQDAIGVEAIITKPFDLERLVHAISRCLTADGNAKEIATAG